MLVLQQIQYDMSVYEALSIVIVISAAFAYINYRFIKLPSTIGIMFIAMLSSMAVYAWGRNFPIVVDEINLVLGSFDFYELLMSGMLSFMLFAGAIHIKIDELKKEKLAIILFSTVSVVVSTFAIGTIVFYLLPLFGLQISYIHCLLFGSLISPTDPIAVLGILKKANISKSLEMKIAGESLFNDGVAVVVFLTILHVAQDPDSLSFTGIASLFLKEAIGGLVLGLAIGYMAFLMMRSIDNYSIEVLITLAVVMGGYVLASRLHISGPLAMVAAGILIGNQGKQLAMSAQTNDYIDKFWELIDETLNAILFVLIGMELLLIDFKNLYLIIGLVLIVLILIVRYFSVWLPAQVIRLKEKLDRNTLYMLTWGGLRGGISIALALSLRPEHGKEIWVALTYIVVAFSILVQGLTVGKLAKKLS